MSRPRGLAPLFNSQRSVHNRMLSLAIKSAPSVNRRSAVNRFPAVNHKSSRQKWNAIVIVSEKNGIDFRIGVLWRFGDLFLT
ncbi:hypothetical protein BC938DRAFT_478554 [Jimgerdemannia flammicorona]|uniref:Uncharacterized protein n=1 Tax=Jimgerdemannia flammicorona TaxID=994334 RepID=A0A433QY95_9FUNG|nr:hypothetical protein BC938DRAFT_478554 [Jimgerdemannia flammicorona]